MFINNTCLEERVYIVNSGQKAQSGFTNLSLSLSSGIQENSEHNVIYPTSAKRGSFPNETAGVQGKQLRTGNTISA